ncbi:glucosidase [Lithospermum erythrorhizon]|uniref:Glucosidase n=1 Tax=Lithospermum erythrorhizon TaxID=34254 RepID=A0AAV3QP99_LITER
MGRLCDDFTIFIIITLIHIIFLYAEIGICYGMIADNLPPPQEVIDLCKQHNIQRLRLYNPVPQALQALQGSGIEVILGVLNEDIQNIASSQAYADQWVNQNVKAFPNVKFKYITLGNEIDSPVVRPFILPAMQNIYNSVNALGIKVSTVLDLSVLGSSYPPSAGK